MEIVGILSINLNSKYMNYGAALHSFAFQQYLNKLNIENYIIDYQSKHVEDINLKYPILTSIKKKQSYKSILSWLLCSYDMVKKYKKFHRFYCENCKMLTNNGNPFTYTYLRSYSESDLFPITTVVCESDVIWSPKTSKGFDEIFFASAPCFSKFKKVTYAGSISNTILTKKEETAFINLLQDFSFLSSRENVTAQYVELLTHKECINVIDPVLLLRKENYFPFTKKIKRKKHYLLVYNCMANDRKMMYCAKQIAKDKNLELLELSDYSYNKVFRKVLTGLGIEEFLGYFNSADYIITNGFHGMCFAIIFEKQFLIFERDGIDIKNKSLTEILGLKERFIYKKEDLAQIEAKCSQVINYNLVNKKLESERKISAKYISSFLNTK